MGGSCELASAPARVLRAASCSGVVMNIRHVAREQQPRRPRRGPGHQRWRADDRRRDGPGRGRRPPRARRRRGRPRSCACGGRRRRPRGRRGVAPPHAHPLDRPPAPRRASFTGRQRLHGHGPSPRAKVIGRIRGRDPALRSARHQLPALRSCPPRRPAGLIFRRHARAHVSEVSRHRRTTPLERPAGVVVPRPPSRRCEGPTRWGRDDDATHAAVGRFFYRIFYGMVRHGALRSAGDGLQGFRHPGRRVRRRLACRIPTGCLTSSSTAASAGSGCRRCCGRPDYAW